MKESWSRWLGPVGGWLDGLTLVEKGLVTVVLTVLGAGWVLVFLGSPSNGVGAADDVPGSTRRLAVAGSVPETPPDAGSSWLDPPGTREAKRLNARIRAIEESILWNNRIRRARLEIQRGPKPGRRGGREVPETAAVILDLKPGADALPPGDEAGIRSMVQHSFNLPRDRISVAVVANDEFREAVSGREEPELQRSLRSEITKLCDRAFDPTEYALAVTVVQSQRTESRETRAFDAEKTLQVPKRTVIEHRPGAFGGLGGAPYVKKTEEREVLPSIARSVVKIPAGEVQSVQVSLLLDVRAVSRLVESGAALVGLPGGTERLPEALDGQERLIARLEQFIGNLIPRNGPFIRQVSVWAVPFKGGPKIAEPAALTRDEPRPAAGVASGDVATVAGQTGSRGPAAGLSTPKPSSSARMAPMQSSSDGKGLLHQVDPKSVVPLGVVLALSVFLLAWWFVRRGSARRLEPEDDEVPDTEALSAREGGYHATELAHDLGGDGSAGALAATPPRLAEDLLQTVDATSASVRERPEVAASVLRLWLAQDSEGGDSDLE